MWAVALFREGVFVKVLTTNLPTVSSAAAYAAGYHVSSEGVAVVLSADALAELPSTAAPDPAAIDRAGEPTVRALFVEFESEKGRGHMREALPCAVVNRLRPILEERDAKLVVYELELGLEEIKRRATVVTGKVTAFEHEAQFTIGDETRFFKNPYADFAGVEARAAETPRRKGFWNRHARRKAKAIKRR